MSSEAYNATCKNIAERAYSQWKIGAPCDALLVELAKNFNVNLIDCRQALSIIITQAHQNRLLERSE